MATVTPVPFALGAARSAVGAVRRADCGGLIARFDDDRSHFPRSRVRRTGGPQPALAHPDRGDRRGLRGVVDLVDGASGQRVALSANTPARRSYDATRSSWACTMVVTIELVGTGALDQRVEARRAPTPAPPTTCERGPRVDLLTLERREVGTRPPPRASGRRRAGPDRSRRNASAPGAASQRACSSDSRAHHRHAEHRVRRVELGRRTEAARYTASASIEHRRREVVRERERHPEHARRLRAVGARAEHPDRGLVAARGHRGDGSYGWPSGSEPSK